MIKDKELFLRNFLVQTKILYFFDDFELLKRRKTQNVCNHRTTLSRITKKYIEVDYKEPAEEK